MGDISSAAADRACYESKFKSSQREGPAKFAGTLRVLGAGRWPLRNQAAERVCVALKAAALHLNLPQTLLAIWVLLIFSAFREGAE